MTILPPAPKNGEESVCSPLELKCVMTVLSSATWAGSLKSKVSELYDGSLKTKNFMNWSWNENWSGAKKNEVGTVPYGLSTSNPSGGGTNPVIQSSHPSLLPGLLAE